MRTRQKCVATDTWRSLGCRTTPLEHWSRRKPTVEPRWGQSSFWSPFPKPFISTVALYSFIIFRSSLYFFLYLSTSSARGYSNIFLGSGGNGNPNLNIGFPTFLQVLECLCVCKLTRFVVSLLSALHVRYWSTNWTISSSDFFSNVGAFSIQTSMWMRGATLLKLNSVEIIFEFSSWLIITFKNCVDKLLYPMIKVPWTCYWIFLNKFCFLLPSHFIYLFLRRFSTIIEFT